MHMMQKLFKKKNPKTKPLRMSGVQKRFFVSYAVIVFAMMWCTTPVLAAGDPLAVVNNLSDFIFSLIRAIGLILLGFGVVQIGLSLKSKPEGKWIFDFSRRRHHYLCKRDFGFDHGVI